MEPGHLRIRCAQLLALIAAVLLITGMILPVVTLTRLWMFDETLSIALGIFRLWQAGQYPLAVLIAGFSVLLPLAKLGVLLRLMAGLDKPRRHERKLLALMHNYGRWAMLDVMVVAMLIVSVKLGVILTIKVQPGLYLFAAGVLLTMLLTQWVARVITARS